MGVQMWCEVRRRGIRPMRLTVRNAQKERRGSTRWTASTTTLTDDDETVYFRPRRNVLRRWCLVSMSCACAETAESRINGRRPVRLESNIAACDLRWCRRARHRMLSGSRQRSRQMDTSLIDVWPQLDSSTFTQYRRLYHSTRCHGQRITRSSRSPSLQSSSLVQREPPADFCRRLRSLWRESLDEDRLSSGIYWNHASSSLVYVLTHALSICVVGCWTCCTRPEPQHRRVWW